MEELKNIDKRLQAVLDKAEELDWSYTVYEEPGQNRRTYVELENYSPAGEDLVITIDFEESDPAESFLADLQEYTEEHFDIDEHVEMWIPKRGKGGCPSTARELLEDAEEIKKMLIALCAAVENLLHPELSDDQVERNDEIYNAAYELCKVVAEDEALEWDMYYLGEIADLAARMMSERGYKVRFPAIVTEEDGSQHIEEIYEP